MLMEALREGRGSLGLRLVPGWMKTWKTAPMSTRRKQVKTLALLLSSHLLYFYDEGKWLVGLMERNKCRQVSFIINFYHAMVYDVAQKPPKTSGEYFNADIWIFWNQCCISEGDDSPSFIKGGTVLQGLGPSLFRVRINVFKAIRFLWGKKIIYMSLNQGQITNHSRGESQVFNTSC